MMWLVVVLSAAMIQTSEGAIYRSQPSLPTELSTMSTPRTVLAGDLSIIRFHSFNGWDQFSHSTVLGFSAEMQVSYTVQTTICIYWSEDTAATSGQNIVSDTLCDTLLGAGVSTIQFGNSTYAWNLESTNLGSTLVDHFNFGFKLTTDQQISLSDVFMTVNAVVPPPTTSAPTLVPTCRFDRCVCIGTSCTVSGNLDIPNGENIADSFDVDGDLTLTGNVTLNNVISVNGTAAVNGVITVSPGSPGTYLLIDAPLGVTGVFNVNVVPTFTVSPCQIISEQEQTTGTSISVTVSVSDDPNCVASTISTGAIAGIAVGVIVVGMLVAVLVRFVWLRQKNVYAQSARQKILENDRHKHENAKHSGQFS